MRTPGLILALAATALCGCGKDEAVGDRTPARAPAAEAAVHVARAGHDWPMFGLEPQKSNASARATGLTAKNASRLPRRRRVTLPGTVDSSPVYLHAATVRGKRRPVVIVTTTYGRTLALSAPTGRELWRFQPASYAKLKGTYRITTATPVVDAARRYVYSTSPDGFLHKLRVADGREAGGRWPVRMTRLPEREKLASSLNLVGRRLIVATDGYIGDAPPYQGHVVLVDRVSGKIDRVWNSLCAERRSIQAPSTCPASDSAIWGRAGVVYDAARQHLLLATGNAPYDGRRNFGDSVVVLSYPGLKRVGGWTPANQDELNSQDLDLGSTSPALLPGDLAVQGGKAGKLDLIDLHRGRSLQTVPTPGGAPQFTSPAVYRHGGKVTIVETTEAGTTGWALRGRRLHRLWSNGHGGTSPVIAGGLAWVYDPSGALDVYGPDSGRRVAHLPAGSGHWNSPVIADGHVWLPEGDANDHATTGTLSIYSLP